MSPQHPAIREVILSGGDPLVLSDAKLGGLLRRIAAIPHVEGIRIHTRVPVTLPMRVTPGLAAALDADKTLWIVTHFNHPRELTPEAIARLPGAAPGRGAGAQPERAAARGQR